jgi:ABC-type transport system involved in multi-copper enzyme maturation permease subunit
LTPLYLAGTIAEEKETRTLELVFQTQLTDGEILLGKLAARVTHLIYLVLLSLPMLAIITLWGGVDIELLAFHFTCLVLLIVLVSSICLLASVTASTVIEATLLCYGFEFLVAYVGMWIGAILSALAESNDIPVSKIVEFMGKSGLLAAIGAISLSASYVLYRLARWYLSALRTWGWRRSGAAPVAKQPTGAPRYRRPTRAVWENALLGKEITHDQRNAALPLAIHIAGGIGMLLLCGLALYFRHIAPPHERDLALALRVLFIAGYFCLATILCTFTTLYAAATVAREQEQKTLDFLLLLPVERWEILLTKAVAPWAANRVTVLMLLAYPPIGIMLGMLPPNVGLALFLLPWPSLLFGWALALLLTVVCKRVRVVYVAMGVILALILLGHVLCYRVLGLILLGVWHVLGLPEIPKQLGPYSTDEAILALAIHQTLLLVAAACCVGLAFWFFRRRT